MDSSRIYQSLVVVLSMFLADACYNIVAASTEYVGVEACAQCHTDAAKAWRGSHHDLAMQVADEETVLGNFNSAGFDYYGVRSLFFKKNGQFYVNTEDAEGKLADFEIKYTFGADPLQQYLVEFDDGRLQALPIAWDSRPETEGGQRWFHLYPDEHIRAGDELHWTGPNQNWNFMCAECHSVNLQRNYDADTDTYATTFSEINVSCEACHGPGSRHVEWAQSGAGNDDHYGLAIDLRRGGQWAMSLDSGIAANTSTAGPSQIDTCARCHSRRIVLSGDYRHGEPLTRSYRPQVLQEGLYYSDGQIRDEVYVYGSFIQSKMYDRGVTCTDCHQPHSLKLKAQGNAQCATCHLPARFDTVEHHFHEPGTVAARCVTCHMPARVYMGHDSRRDHSFRVPRPDLSDQTQSPDVCTDCHQGRSPKWAAQVIQEKTGNSGPRPPHFGVAIQAGRAGLLDAEAQLIALADDTSQPDIARATAAALLGGYLGPSSIQTLAVLLRDEDPLVRVNAISALDAADARLKVQLVPPLLNDPVLMVRIEAAISLANVPGDMMSAEQRQSFGPTIDEYIEVQISNSDRVESWTNLGNLYLRLGTGAKALAQYEQALKLDPNYAPAYVNLADLYRSEQQDQKAEQVLLAGIARLPGAGSLHHAYGLLLVRQKNLQPAITEFKRSVELEPENTRFRYVYAIALNATGDASDAIEELRKANALDPADNDVLIALINFHRQQGDTAGARKYAADLVKRSPWDRNAQNLLQELSR
jgi:Flp pilus assembly protein TadD